MRWIVLPVVLALTLNTVSSAQEEQQCNEAYQQHWAHCISVPAVKDVASITTLTVAVDNFCGVIGHGDELHGPISVSYLSRDKQGRFSTKDWVSHKPIYKAWFQLDAKGTPTYHVIPKEGSPQEVYKLRRIRPADGKPPKQHVWLIQKYFPYCTQPRFVSMYQNLSWWKVFDQRDKWLYALKSSYPYKIFRFDRAKLMEKLEMRKKLAEAKRLVNEVGGQDKKK